MATCSRAYRRRKPEETVLYEAIRRHYRTFRTEAEAADRSVPGFVEREFEKFNRCGILAYGFAPVHCGECGHDRVLPAVPMRTWTLTFPHPLRYLLAYHPSILSEVISAYKTALFNWQKHRAKALFGLKSISHAHSGMATWVQRFGSAANLNVHLHSLVFDGVFVETDSGEVEWRGLPQPDSCDVASIAWEVCTRVVKALRKRGLSLAGEAGDIDELAEREPLLAACYTASLTGFVATGRRAGSRVSTMGFDVDAQEQQPKTQFAHGFNLFAGRRIARDDRRKREHVIRYMARPPIPEGALSWTQDGLARIDHQ